MSGIFISYRRSDASGYAGRLYERLAKHFGKQRVFMDIDTLQPGLDFGQALDNAVSGCDVLIALIGPNWLRAVDAEGNRRIDNPDDFVRLEIATALSREGVRVIPVLVGNAQLPHAVDLPDDLKPLARRHSVELSDQRWDFDVGRLIARLETVVPPGRRRTAVPSGPMRMIAIGVPSILALVALMLAVGPFRILGGDDSDPTATPVLATEVPPQLAMKNATPEATATLAPTTTPMPEPTATPTVRSTEAPASTPTLPPTATATAGPAEAPTVTPPPTPSPAPSPTPTPTPEPPPTIELQDEWFDSGLNDESSYKSPQFGYSATWDQGWVLDVNASPPVRSNRDLDMDQLFLRSASPPDGFFTLYGFEWGSTFTIEQEVAFLQSAEYLDSIFIDNYSVLPPKYDESTASVVVLWEPAGPDYIYLIESHISDDGASFTRTVVGSTPDQFERIHALAQHGIRVDGAPPFRDMITADQIIQAVTSYQLGTPLATPDADLTPNMTATVTATPAPTPTASAPTPTHAPTATSTPPSAPTPLLDPTLEAAGLVTERSYRSPQFGHTVTWDESWMLDPDFTPPITSDPRSRQDVFRLASAELYTPYLTVEGLPAPAAGTVDEAISTIARPERRREIFPSGETEVLLQTSDDTAGGLVLFWHRGDGKDFVYLLEITRYGDSDALVYVSMVATPGAFERAYQRTNATITLDGEPPLSVVSPDDVLDAIDRHAQQERADADMDTEWRISSYASPHFGYVVQWGTEWEIDASTGRVNPWDPGTGSEVLNLTSMETADTHLQFFGEAFRGFTPADILARATSVESLDTFYGPTGRLLLTHTSNRASGMVVTWQEEGVAYVQIVEGYVVHDGSVWLTVIFTAPADDADALHDHLDSQRETTVKIDGNPLISGFDADDVVAAVQSLGGT